MNIEADARPRKRAWNHRAVSLVAPCVLLLVLMLMEPDVPLVIFAGILLAVLISASGRWIGRCVGIPRGIGIGLFLLMTIVGLAGFFTAFLPAILEQTNAFVEQTPAAIEALRERVAGLLWPDRMLAGVSPFSLFSGESAAMAAGAVRATFAGLGNFLIVLLIGLFGGLGVDVYRRGPLSARGPDWRGQAVLLVVAMFGWCGRWRAMRSRPCCSNARCRCRLRWSSRHNF